MVDNDSTLEAPLLKGQHGSDIVEDSMIESLSCVHDPPMDADLALVKVESNELRKAPTSLLSPTSVHALNVQINAEYQSNPLHEVAADDRQGFSEPSLQQLRATVLNARGAPSDLPRRFCEEEGSTDLFADAPLEDEVLETAIVEEDHRTSYEHEAPAAAYPSPSTQAKEVPADLTTTEPPEAVTGVLNTGSEIPATSDTAVQAMLERAADSLGVTISVEPVSNGLEREDDSDAESSASSSSDESSSRFSVGRAADALTDDEDSDSGRPTGRVGKTGLVTANEREPSPPAPPALESIPDEEDMRHLGKVHSIVDSVVVVLQSTDPAASPAGRLTTSRPIDMNGRRGADDGEYSVLDTDSLLVFDDRSVLGLIYETFGSVLAPHYSIRFPTSAIPEHIKIGRPVFYSPSRSTYVLTRALRAASGKGSDASNVFDEEIAEHEMEYSDDEEEAAAKKRRRAKGSSNADSSVPIDRPIRGKSAKGGSSTPSRRTTGPPITGRGRGRGRGGVVSGGPSALPIRPRFDPDAPPVAHGPPIHIDPHRPSPAPYVTSDSLPYGDAADTYTSPARLHFNSNSVATGDLRSYSSRSAGFQIPSLSTYEQTIPQHQQHSAYHQHQNAQPQLPFSFPAQPQASQWQMHSAHTEYDPSHPGTLPPSDPSPTQQRALANQQSRQRDQRQPQGAINPRFYATWQQSSTPIGPPPSAFDGRPAQQFQAFEHTQGFPDPSQGYPHGFNTSQY